MAERNIIAEMLEEELDRNARAQAAYAAELGRLPRGRRSRLRPHAEQA